jgi:hypothetical protein
MKIEVLADADSAEVASLEVGKKVRRRKGKFHGRREGCSNGD